MLAGMAMAALPGTVERLYTLAQALRALKPGAPLTVMAPKTKGGNRIAKELGAFDKEFASHVRDGIVAFNVPEPRLAK